MPVLSGLELELWAIAHTTSRDVPSAWRPVLIYQDGVPCGFGSYACGLVVTTAHTFVYGEEHQWSYRCLRPASERQVPIALAYQLSSVTAGDVAVCLTGKGTPALLPGFYTAPEDQEAEKREARVFDTPLQLTSLVSGEQVRCPAVRPLGRSHYLLGDMKVREGMGGVGFVLGTSKMLFVLKGWMEIPRSMQVLCGLSRNRVALFSQLAYAQ